MPLVLQEWMSVRNNLANGTLTYRQILNRKCCFSVVFDLLMLMVGRQVPDYNEQVKLLLNI